MTSRITATDKAQSVLRLAKLSLGSLVVGVAAVTGLGGLNLYTYQRFTSEVPVAELQFVQLAPSRFRATLSDQTNGSRSYIIEGDEWQLDVRMIKWTDWLTFLGESPLYRLDRLSGRYLDVAEARSLPVTAHSLAETTGIDLWAFARRSGEWLPGVDAAYGSSVFLPMRDGEAYSVSMSRTGLLARPLEAVAEQ